MMLPEGRCSTRFRPHCLMHTNVMPARGRFFAPSRLTPQVDLTRSYASRGTAALGAKRTAGVDVKPSLRIANMDVAVGKPPVVKNVRGIRAPVLRSLAIRRSRNLLWAGRFRRKARMRKIRRQASPLPARHTFGVNRIGRGERGSPNSWADETLDVSARIDIEALRYQRYKPPPRRQSCSISCL